MLSTGSSDSLEFFQQLYASVVSDNDQYKALMAGKQQVRDALDRRRLQILFPECLAAKVESDKAVAQLRDSLAPLSAQTSSAAAEYNEVFQSEPTNRERVYREQASAGSDAANAVQRLIRLRDQAAHRVGYTRYLGILAGQPGLAGADIDRIIRQLDSSTTDSYRAIVEQAEASSSSGRAQIWDLNGDYASLSRQVDSYFPVDSQIPFVERSMLGIGFDLRNLPVYMEYQTGTDRMSSGQTVVIKAPFDVRLRVSQTNGLQSLRDFLYAVGRALSTVNIRQSQPLYGVRISETLIDGMAQVISGLPNNDNWLESFGVPSDLANRYRAARRRYEIVRTRSMMAATKFEREAYGNPQNDLNKLYWATFERIMLLPGHEELKPWAASTNLVRNPLRSQEQLLARLLAAQIESYLNENFGGLAGNSNAAAYLAQNYYRFGSRYPWQELLERGTEEKLNPSYLVAQLEK